jgi:hypothetical protein
MDCKGNVSAYQNTIHIHIDVWLVEVSLSSLQHAFKKIFYEVSDFINYCTGTVFQNKSCHTILSLTSVMFGDQKVNKLQFT